MIFIIISVKIIIYNVYVVIKYYLLLLYYYRKKEVEEPQFDHFSNLTTTIQADSVGLITTNAYTDSFSREKIVGIRWQDVTFPLKMQ